MNSNQNYTSPEVYSVPLFSVSSILSGSKNSIDSSGQQIDGNYDGDDLVVSEWE